MFKHWYLKFVSVLSVFSFINMSLTVDACAFGYEPRLPENSFNRVYYLASQGQVSALRRAMERGLDINGVNEHGDAGICVAVRRQDRMAYDTFRAVGASLNPPCRGRIPYWDYFVDPEKARQLAAQRAAEARQIAEEQAAQRAAEEEATRKTAEAAKKTSDRKWGVWPWVLGAGAVGGIAIVLASGGGGGGGSSHNDGGSQKPTPTPDKCENVSCPANSSCHEGKCLCYEGYQSWNGLCYESLDCGVNAHQEGDECYCDDGYDLDENNQCVKKPISQECGANSTWNGTECVCNEGYISDENGNCVKKPTSDECGGYGHKVDGVCVCDEGYGLNGEGNCEAFLTSDEAFVISSEKIINNAKPLKNSGKSRAGVWGGIYTKNGMVINEGEILLEGGKNGVGILSCSSPTWECMTTPESLKTNSQMITNSGRITINADESVGIFASNLTDSDGTFFKLTNNGDIKLNGTDNAGIVLYNKGLIENNGNITLEGTAKTSAGDNQWANTGIYLWSNSLLVKNNIITNKGNISLNLKAGAEKVNVYGIYLDGAGGGLTNNGNINISLTDAALNTDNLDYEFLYPYQIIGLYSDGTVEGSGAGKTNMIHFAGDIMLKGNALKTGIYAINSEVYYQSGTITIESDGSTPAYGFYGTGVGSGLYIGGNIKMSQVAADAKYQPWAIYSTGGGGWNDLEIFSTSTIDGNVYLFGGEGKNDGTVNGNFIFIGETNTLSDTGTAFTNNGSIHGNLLFGGNQPTQFINNSTISADKIDMTYSDSSKTIGAVTGVGGTFENSKDGTINVDIASTEGSVYGITLNGNQMTNNGIIDVKSKAETYGIWASGDKSSVINSGTVKVTGGEKQTIGLYARGGTHTNSGRLEVSGQGNVYGVNLKGGTFTNDTGAHLNISSPKDDTTQQTYGIYSDGGTVINKGFIEVAGNKEKTYGIYGINSAKITNTGEIIMHLPSDNGVTATNGCNGTTCDGSKTYEKDGYKFIVLDTSSTQTNAGKMMSSLPMDFDAFGGTTEVTTGGTFKAPALKGRLRVAAETVADGFEDTYKLEEALDSDKIDVKAESGSAAFEAAVSGKDLVMTRRGFDQLSADDTIAKYLEANYAAGNNEQAFRTLKLTPDSKTYRKTEAELLGYRLLPNFSRENMTLIRNLNTVLNDELFSKSGEIRKIVGYDYQRQGRNNRGTLTGYDNYANTSYFMYDRAGDSGVRGGLGMSITQFHSDYDDDSSRKEMMVQALAPVSYDLANGLRMASIARFGYGDGEYKRRTANGTYESDLSEWIYGLSNEARYDVDLGYLTLEPVAEFNVLGYYQNRIREDKGKALAIKADGENNLSVEGGLGINVRKEMMINEKQKLKLSAGAMYYHEFAKPYHSLKASLRGTEGTYRITDYENLYDRDRGVISAGVDYDWDMLTFYAKYRQYIEHEYPFSINAGVKVRF